jgi:hypothetical protein
MDSRKYNFLKAVLGDQGAEALAKAAERSESVEGVLIPRTVMAWLGVVSRFDYEGTIPGVDDAYIDFAKNEYGTWDGSVAVGHGVFPFENASLVQLAASIAVALDSNSELPEIRDVDIVRLGKSIDILVKSKYVSDAETELAKAFGAKQQGKGVTGQTRAAPAHAPLKHTGPKPPETVQPRVKQREPKKTLPKIPRKIVPPKTAMPKKKSEPHFHLTEANLKKSCSECGLQPIKNGKFVGCMCLRDLAKHIELVGENLTFHNMDADSISVVLETLGVK